MSEYCNYDNNGCGEACNSQKTCYPFMINNDVWDEDCRSVSQCGYDGDDCLCAPDCNFELQFNDECNSECFVESCNWDEGNCGDCAIGCWNWMLDQDECFENCNNQEC